MSCSNVQDPKPPDGDKMEVLSTLVVEETDPKTPANFGGLGVCVSCFYLFDEMCAKCSTVLERKHIFIMHTPIFWSVGSIHYTKLYYTISCTCVCLGMYIHICIYIYICKYSIISCAYIFVVELIVHVACSNLQEPMPQHGDEMEVLSTLVVQETS